jgi:hypothetical protein
MRFKKQQNPSGCIRIEIVFAADVVNQIMATHHSPKKATRARSNEASFDQSSLDLAFLFLVLGDGLPVDQQDPVEIATGGHFLTGDRSKYNQTRVGRPVCGELSGEIVTPAPRLGSRLANGLPRGPSMRFKSIQL